MVGATAVGSAVSSNDSGQLGIACAGVAGSSSGGAACARPCSSEDGGQAGIAGSVGGSGGQMSVSSGGAGADSAAGGHVFLAGSPATDWRGLVSGASTGGSVVAAAGGVVSSSWSTGSSTVSPGDVGTVWAQPGADFLPSPLAEVSVFDQSGSPFCIGSGGNASSSVPAASPLPSAGSTGTV
jgi:hypothetical protein